MIAMEKKIIRQQIITARKNLNLDFVNQTEDVIYDKFVNSNFLNFNSYLVYSDFGNEVRTKRIIDYLLDHNREVYLPKCNVFDETFVPIKISKNTKYSVNKYGISEPAEDIKENELIKLECVIVPGIAFDVNGNRIGFGCGYYDKFLKEHNLLFKIALCYDFQVIDNIKSSEHDVPMDVIFTEKRIIECRR